MTRHPTISGSRVTAFAGRLLAALLATASLTAGCTFKPVYDPVSEAKLKEVQQLIAELPRFPDFKEVGGTTRTRSDRILISKYFSSKASYEDVKNYYYQLLTSRGWRQVEERPLSVWGDDQGAKLLTFIKGEFLLSIQYEGRNNVGRNYALGYAWDSPEFRRMKGLPLT